MADKKGKLCSQHWHGGTSRDAFIHRSWMKNQGIPDDNFDGRPVIGICSTFSELTPCNAHFRAIVSDSIEDFKAKIDDPDLDIDFLVGSRGAEAPRELH